MNHIKTYYNNTVFFKNQPNALIKYSKADYKTHFLSGVNTCIFRHQGAIIREFINNKSSYIQHII